MASKCFDLSEVALVDLTLMACDDSDFDDIGISCLRQVVIPFQVRVPNISKRLEIVETKNMILTFFVENEREMREMGKIREISSLKQFKHKNLSWIPRYK